MSERRCSSSYLGRYVEFFCLRVAGHDGNHRGAGREWEDEAKTWVPLSISWRQMWREARRLGWTIEHAKRRVPRLKHVAPIVERELRAAGRLVQVDVSGKRFVVREGARREVLSRAQAISLMRSFEEQA